MHLHLQHISDVLEQGLIIINREGIIQVYNHVAQDFFGLLPSSGPGHPSGQIEPGDIVILADNRIGRDDGNLGHEHFSQLGLGRMQVRPDTGILAVCQYNGDTFTPAVRLFEDTLQLITLDYAVAGINIQVTHDRSQRLLSITVDDTAFPYLYHIAVGHIVVLNQQMQVKFYQAPGYTARTESIGDILSGKPWTAKGLESAPEVVGKHISDLHSSNLGIERLLQVAAGHEDGFVKQDYEINGIPTRCSIHPIDINGVREGAMLQVTDISEMRIAEEERDQARASLKLSDSNPSLSKISGTSLEMDKIRGLVDKASRSNSTVLLLGESGTGKGLVAEVIHQAGSRSHGPFIYVNCAAIPSNLLESELFGYAPGAFTGAKSEGKIGSFQQAQSGTLFLDEIGELDITLQAKLLHAIQTRRIQRLGDDTPVDLDVRIIAATNRHLEQAVKEGSFREDLYYRLNVISITLPPLRQRPGDIPALVDYLLPKICNRAGKTDMTPHPQLIRALTNYHWPGNIRELENVLERAVNFSEGKVLTPEHLPLTLHTPTPETAITINQVISHQQAIELTERSLIQLALETADNNRSQAMEMLKMGRTNFYQKLKKYNLL